MDNATARSSSESAALRNLERVRPLLDRLTAAAAARNTAEFERLLDELVDARRADLVAELRRLTLEMTEALDSFQFDSRLATLTVKDVPDARHRLQHVLKLTEDAAHRTMDLIERCGPLVDRMVGASGKAPGSGEDAAVALGDLRRNLSEMHLAQGYQDLSGQIIRCVITLVDEVESTLSKLLCLTNGAQMRAPQTVELPGSGYGPAVPGVTQSAASQSQADVDTLFDELGL